MKLNLLVIRTNQSEKLLHFYQLLGLSFSHHRHGKGPLHYASESEDFVFEIYPLLKSQNSPDQSTRLGFTVKNLDQLLTELQAAAVEIVQFAEEREWGYSAVVKDPDGRKVDLTEVR